MIVIADSSALVALSVCQCLPVLEQLFGEVKVPEAVFEEVCVPGKPEAEALRAWLRDRVQTVSLSDYPISKAEGLGQGELEAMALYLALSAELLVIDDARVKKVAYLNGVEVMDSVGVLLLAKRRGYLSHIKPLLDILAASDIHLSDTVIQKALTLAGE
jgi:predicted nucleic acid-binding protein